MRSATARVRPPESPHPRPGLVLGSLSLVLAVRVFGLSLVLTSFSPHGATLTDRLFLVGIAFGAYGLATALFQIPLGALSDRIGRRPVILLGSLLTALGSFAAAWAPGILLLGLARFVQGAGAINGVAMAAAADATLPERRTRAMAVLGAAAGGSFAAGLLAGTLLDPLIGARGLFLATGALAIVAGALAAAAIPAHAPTASRRPEEEGWRVLAADLRERSALRVSLAGLSLSASLSALMIVLPLWVGDASSPLLAPAILAGGVVMFVAARVADRGHAAPVLLAAFCALAAAPALALTAKAPSWLFAGVASYFAAHATLSALLPSLASRLARERGRGAVLGAYGVAQSFGAFVGGVLGGALASSGGALLVTLAALGLVGATLLQGVRAPVAARPGPVTAEALPPTMRP